jgi:autotransporter-associated beta strand protein
MKTHAWSGVAILVCAAAAQAATNTWDGGGTDNSWSTGNNWNPDGSVPVSASDTVVQFNGNTRPSPSQNIATPFLLNRLDFIGGTTMINVGGNQLQFVANGATQPRVYLNRNQSCAISTPINIPAGTTLFAEIGTYGITLSGAISGVGAINGAISEGGASAIIKQDAGTWTLGGASTFTGQLTVANGMLKLGAAGSLNPQVGLAFSCATGWYSVAHATFDLNGRNQTVSQLSGSMTHAFLTNILTSATAPTLVVDQRAPTASTAA